MARRRGNTGKKAVAGQVEQRTHEVVLLILSGADRADILRYAAENKWRLQERQIETYIAKARNRIAESLKPEADHALELALARRRMLYSRALEQGDIKAALAVLKDESELRGQYPPKKIAPTTPQGDKPYEHAAGLAPLLPELRAAVERLRSGLGEALAGEVAGAVTQGSVEDGPALALHPGRDAT